MVLFDDVVQISALAQLDLGASVSLDALNGRCVCPLLPKVIFFGKSCRLMARLRKRLAAAISLLGSEKEVNRIACPINGPV
ncbi:MAG: hypothetical protein K2X64_05390 [Rhodocyclaceae bacterium]|nr:hypothetical protein [Rhodocyclaceae bacterium]